MKKIVLALTVSVLGILIASTAYGAEANEPLAQDYGITNYSIAYFENDKITYENYGYGIDENSVFELASNGKVVSAYIALKLVDEGKISLEDQIAPFLDANLLTDDKRLSEITLKQLLCHTAGFSTSFELGVDKKIYSNPGDEFCYSGVGYIYLKNVIENVSGMTIEQAAKYYVFEPLGMSNSTFEYAKTVTPYMSLSSVVLYTFTVFIIILIIFFLIAFVVGRITKFKLYSLKSGLFVCFVMAGIINTLFLLFVFVSKVVIIFELYFLLIGLSLLITRKNNRLFYSCIPVLTIIILVLGFTIPISMPVTNDLVSKEPNCAYTLKSTSKDMAIFCRELMQQYNSGQGTIKDMFSAAVNIDPMNSWGLGIAIELESNGETYWHSGINPGFQSLFVLYPLQDKYVVILTNSDNGLTFSKDIAKTFFGINGYWDIKR